MYRLIKTDNNKEEVLRASEDEQIIRNAFINTVLDHASNGSEYTQEDIAYILLDKKERVGPYIYSMDEVTTLTDAQIVKLGGGVCAHCHSDDTDGHSCDMNEGFVERTITCNICNQDTTEQYSLSGIE